MRYIMKQKIFSLTDSFTIQDAQGNPAFKVKGKLLSLGDKLDIYRPDGEKVAQVQQKVFSLGARYRVLRDGEVQAMLKKRRFTLVKDKFDVKMYDGAPDIEIEGNILEHNYRFERAGRAVARVSKQWVSLRDSYGIDIVEGEDDVLILACAIIIDMINHNDSD
ncbi:MAG: LURP-one-related/scramblase family protein [Anaerolineales bacterium]